MRRSSGISRRSFMRVPTRRCAPDRGRGDEAVDLLGQMLPIAIERSHVCKPRSSQCRRPVLIDSPLPRFCSCTTTSAPAARAFAAVASWSRHPPRARDRFASTCAQRPRRCAFLLERGNDGGDRRPVHRAGAGALSILSARLDENPPRDTSCGPADRKRHARNPSRARFRRKRRSAPA